MARTREHAANGVHHVTDVDHADMLVHNGLHLPHERRVTWRHGASKPHGVRQLRRARTLASVADTPTTINVLQGIMEPEYRCPGRTHSRSGGQSVSHAELIPPCATADC